MPALRCNKIQYLVLTASPATTTVLVWKSTFSIAPPKSAYTGVACTHCNLHQRIWYTSDHDRYLSRTILPSTSSLDLILVQAWRRETGLLIPWNGDSTPYLKFKRHYLSYSKSTTSAWTLVCNPLQKGGVSRSTSTRLTDNRIKPG